MNDEWNNCYQPPHNQISPNDFTNLFCRVCRNGACSRSGISTSKWMQRIARQQDELLVHPKFANPNDPKFADIRNIDFPSVLRTAMALEIADRKGDWSIPSAQDATKLAADIAAKPVPLPPVVNDIPVVDDKEESTLYQMSVKGSSGDIYDVSFIEEINDNTEWRCTCPAWIHGRSRPCKHIQYVQGQYEAQKTDKPAPQHFQTEAPKLSPPPSNKPPIPPRVNMPVGNTPTNNQGIMIGGQSPMMRPNQRVAAPPVAKRTPIADPWSLPSQNDKVIPVGGKVVLGKKDDE